jgi:hypothetical protein
VTRTCDAGPFSEAPREFSEARWRLVRSEVTGSIGWGIRYRWVRSAQCSRSWLIYEGLHRDRSTMGTLCSHTPGFIVIAVSLGEPRPTMGTLLVRYEALHSPARAASLDGSGQIQVPKIESDIPSDAVLSSDAHLILGPASQLAQKVVGKAPRLPRPEVSGSMPGARSLTPRAALRAMLESSILRGRSPRRERENVEAQSDSPQCADHRSWWRVGDGHQRLRSDRTS